MFALELFFVEISDDVFLIQNLIVFLVLLEFLDGFLLNANFSEGKNFLLHGGLGFLYSLLLSGFLDSLLGSCYLLDFLLSSNLLGFELFASTLFRA